MDIAPTWILAAILRVETGSSIGHFGVVPGKVTRGRHGERGAMQMRRAAFDEVALPGESFALLESDHELSVRVGNRYLVSLHNRLGSWDKAIMAYNAGPSNYHAGRNYLQKIKAAK
jgi:soluble lytic murein transglycosylase-like protein